MWVQGIKVRFSGLVASMISTEHTCQPHITDNVSHWIWICLTHICTGRRNKKESVGEEDKKEIQANYLEAYSECFLLPVCTSIFSYTCTHLSDTYITFIFFVETGQHRWASSTMKQKNELRFPPVKYWDYWHVPTWKSSTFLPEVMTNFKTLRYNMLQTFLWIYTWTLNKIIPKWTQKWANGMPLK